MDIPAHIFKMYDIRGLIETEITETLAESIGNTFAGLLQKEYPGKRLTVAVGRDMRPSSPRFQEALTNGLRAAGVDVIDIGLVSTPAFYFGVGHVKADGGVMVSASHNPAEYNGFKLVRANAIPVSGDSGIQTLAEMCAAGVRTEVEEKGTLRTVEGIPAEAVKAEMAFVGEASVKKFKIVVDSANGMGAQYLDELFTHVDLDVMRMYWDFDGSFPNHGADPLKDENTVALRAKVKELGADFGIATDGDGDRIFFVDNEGNVVMPAILRGLLAQITLRKFPGATICYDIRPGKITEDMILEAGGKPSLTRVGHSLIKEQMRKEGAVFGGESSGHFFYAFPEGTFEGPVAVTLQILQELTRTEKTFADLVRPYYRYVHSGEINYHVADKQAVIDRLKELYKDAEISTLDGVTITYPTFWFNVRPSNTESLLRLNLEAVDSATMEAKRDEIAKIMQA